MCPELLELDLISNPVCYLNNYRNEVKNFVSNLVLLDGIPFSSAPNDVTSDMGNTSSEFSSLSDNTRSDVSNNEIVMINHQLPRPSSFGNIPTENKTIRINRPSTAGLFVNNIIKISSSNEVKIYRPNKSFNEQKFIVR